MEITESDIKKEEAIMMKEYNNDLSIMRKKFGEWITDDLWTSCGYFNHFNTIGELWYAYLMMENHFIIWDDKKKIWRTRIVMW